MAPNGGLWAVSALRVVTKNLGQASKLIRSKIASATRPLNADLQPVTIRAVSNGGRHPIHPSAWLRQQKRFDRWFSNLPAGARRLLSSAAEGRAARPRFDRSTFPISQTSRAVAQLTGRTPFASALRPNLTGGTLPRTAGGYASYGAGGRVGGSRFFSHTPAAPAEIVQNVSQAMRAFWLSGQRARFDGMDKYGNPRYRAVSAAHQDRCDKLAAQLPRIHAPGSFVDFKVSPTITALTPLGAAFPLVAAAQEALGAENGTPATLNAEGFLDVLSVDFARVLKDLGATMADLQKLSALGDLPITLEKGSVLRVRFPGLDAETVERLCEDVGCLRGLVGQDPDFDTNPAVNVALRFPFAPGLDDDAKTLTSPWGSLREHRSDVVSSELEEEEAFFLLEDKPWLSSSPGPETEEYASMSPPLPSTSGEHASGDYEGLEGIYRFMEECDRAKGRFGMAH